jgi:DNA-binding winged helix-turn-helix (wHTH) protein
VSTKDNLFRFGAFELDASTGELRKHGVRLRLPDQPFRVLIALLEHPHELVTREELHKRVWPEDTFVDFEQGLNRAVNKLREALGDSAATPRFIETLPGRGYRFIGPLRQNEATDPAPEPEPPAQAGWARGPMIWTGSALALALLISAWLFRPVEIQELKQRKLTSDNYAKFAPVVSDGARLYFRAAFEGEMFLATAPATGGPAARMSLVPPAPFFQLQDISPDGQDLLVTATAGGGVPPALWALRPADGGARKLVNGPAYAAAYSPGGDRILYASGESIWLCSASGANPKKLYTARDARIWQLSWSNDGRMLRWAQENPATPSTTAWEMEPGGTARQVLAGWPDPRLIPLGWTLGGRVGLFDSGGMLWARMEQGGLVRRGSGEPVRMTDGEPEIAVPVRTRHGQPVRAIGTDRLGELQRYDPAGSKWVSLLDGASAESLLYSPDGKRLLYVSYPQRELWVRQTDGSRPVQLTSPPLAVSHPRWSPDGKRIAFIGRQPSSGLGRVYLIDAEGGAPRAIESAEPVSYSDPVWLSDGRLAFGIQGNTGKPEWVYLRVVDPRSGKPGMLAGTRGLYSPRCCSPTGELAALRWRLGPGGREVVVLDARAERVVAELPGVSARHPEWVPGRREIAFFERDNLASWVLGRDKPETWMKVAGEEIGGFSRSITFAPDGSLIRTLSRDRQQVYELEVVTGRR